jgi:drug/metabolite transporter (DMT)-like permease
VSTGVAIALALALASTTLTNVAYLRQHEAAAALPVLSLRRPLHAARLLLTDRSWLLGFAMETGGFALYAAALALAPLALVQSIAAGGIGVLAYLSARFAGRRLRRHEIGGVVVSVLGLVALAVSLVGGERDGRGSTLPIVVWLAATAAVALVVLGVGRRVGGMAVAQGAAGGLFFAIGDISTKVATQGGERLAFILTVVAGYALGTWLLQLGYQLGGALTVAGVATLFTNALPIVAGTIVLDEPVPSGALGWVRLLAFAAVVVGAILLTSPDGRAAPQATAAT